MIRPAAALIAGSLFLSIGTAAHDAQAGDYPERSIKLVVPTTAGSGPDLVARLVGERLAASMGQQVVVENRPGAIGTIGLNAVAKAPPDGYTLGILTTAFLAAPSLIAEVPYDTERDLSPVAIVTSGFQNLNVWSTLPVYSVSQLVSEARTRPGVLKYSSQGNGTPAHLVMKQFEQQMGIELVHVPYKGGPPATTALVRGDVDVCIAGMITMAPHIKSGAVRALATFAPRRLANYPELPTMAELGYPELEFSGWVGVVAPAGTPRAVIERLSRALADIGAEPDTKDRLGQWDMEPARVGASEFGSLIHRELHRYRRLVRDGRITVE
jgi:tripartite-type tricarboxylate transporter receptor subunit TctC